MKIVDLKVDVIRLPPSAFLPEPGLDVAIVRVLTDDGITGIGEASAAAAVVRAVIDAPAIGTMSHSIRDILVGRDPLEVATIWEDLYRLTIYPGHRGAFLHAMSAIDVALWDILGKRAGLPVYKLLGGAFTTSPRVYVTQLMPSSEAAIRSAAEQATAEGWSAMKFGWLPSGLTEGQTSALIRAARAGAGTPADLMIDVGWAWERRNGSLRHVAPWNFRTALSHIQAWQAEGLAWVEEPLPPDDLSGYRRLVGRVTTPVAAGEQETTRFGLIRLIDEACIDVLQPDVGRIGGLTEGRRAAQAAADRNCGLAPHCYGTHLHLIASAHLAASSATCTFCEYPRMLSVAPAIVHPVPAPHEGVIELSDAPGLGVDLDDDLINSLRVTP